MRWLPKHCLAVLLLLLAVGPCDAGTPAPASASMPDYGGRDAPGLLSGAGADAPDPVAQAGRSVLALVIVLGGVFGAVILLKRAGYKGGGPVAVALLSGLRRTIPDAPREAAGTSAPVADTSGPLALLQSQILPGGGAVHLLCVHDRTLVLVGATERGVSRIAEWEWEDEDAVEAAPEPRPDFQEYLARVDVSPDRTRVLERLPGGALSDLLSTQSVRFREGTHT